MLKKKLQMVFVFLFVVSIVSCGTFYARPEVDDAFLLQFLERISEDLAGIIVIPVDNSVLSEDSNSKIYSVKMLYEPSSNVFLRIYGDEQIYFSNETVTFFSSDWTALKNIEIFAVDDNLQEGLHQGKFTIDVSSDDESYEGLYVTTPDVQIEDNDSIYIDMHQ